MTDRELLALAEKTVAVLNEKRLTAATAESCTGGYIAKLLTDVSGASAVFHCGIVSYSNDVKRDVLGVSDETLSSYGAVSEQTVLEMESGVRRLARADIGVAVSGIAGPNAEGTTKPAGLIWFCCGNKTGQITYRMQNTFPENIRDNNRRAAAACALRMIIDMAENDSETGGDTYGE